jgi:hypothetical protein
VTSGPRRATLGMRLAEPRRRSVDEPSLRPAITARRRSSDASQHCRARMSSRSPLRFPGPPGVRARPCRSRKPVWAFSPSGVRIPPLSVRIRVPKGPSVIAAGLRPPWSPHHRAGANASHRFHEHDAKSRSGDDRLDDDGDQEDSSTRLLVRTRRISRSHAARSNPTPGADDMACA